MFLFLWARLRATMGTHTTPRCPGARPGPGGSLRAEPSRAGRCGAGRCGAEGGCCAEPCLAELCLAEPSRAEPRCPSWHTACPAGPWQRPAADEARAGLITMRMGRLEEPCGSNSLQIPPPSVRIGKHFQTFVPQIDHINTPRSGSPWRDAPRYGHLGRNKTSKGDFSFLFSLS